jgi:hypothetical protein
VLVPKVLNLFQYLFPWPCAKKNEAIQIYLNFRSDPKERSLGELILIIPTIKIIIIIIVTTGTGSLLHR